MPYNLVIPIYSLDLPPKTTVELSHDVYISNDHQILINNGLANDFFAQEVGMYHNWIIGSLPFVFIKTYESFDIREVGEKYNAYIAFMLWNLWFIKDNAVYNSLCFIQDLNDMRKVTVNQRNIFISNCQGEYKNVLFNLNDLERLKIITQEQLKLRPKINNDFKERVSGDSGNIIGTVNFIPYNSYSRIMRSNMFLQNARANSFMPMKISSYVACLECIFTTDNSEVNHKVSERAVLYLGGTGEEKLKRFDLIKKAYGVRSNYFHGGTLEKKVSSLEALKSISEYIDQLLREIFEKVIKDKEIFDQDNSKLGEYFKKLVLDR